MRPLIAQFCWIAALIAAFTTPAPEVGAQSVANGGNRIQKLKAAYILNFIKYSEWPKERFEHAESPIIITIVGETDWYETLREGARVSGPIGGRQLLIQRLRYPQPNPSGGYDQIEVDAFYEVMFSSHLVSFCSIDPEALRPILQRLHGRNVLTVGDIPDFCETGGMLGLLIRGNRMIFQANPDEIKRTDLNVSAKILKLAEIVQTRSAATDSATTQVLARRPSHD